MPESLLYPADAALDTRPHCPTDDDLLAFIPGQLSGDDAAALVVHLETCGVCQTRVTTLKKRLSGESNQHPPGNAPPIALPGSEPTVARTVKPTRKLNYPKTLGQYELLHPIGRGGMGMVFKALHPRLNRHVAIKLLPGLHLSEQTAIVRLQRETTAAGKVEHDNVVYAFDAGEQEGVDYLVMEYVEGVDLSRLVAVCGPVPIADACELARQVALGLAHLESRGLVHRDIKPSNLMLSSAGVVKILDLGLARLRDGLLDESEATHSGFLLGTADYVAPEQIDAPKTADVHSDLYSLGCTLFKLLAGRAPFGDEAHSSVSRKIDAHRREAPPDLRALRPEVPEALNALVVRLLSKHADERPAHAGDVAEELAAFAGGAELLALAAKAGESAFTIAEQSGLPHPSHSRTPQSHDGDTDSKGSSITPAGRQVGSSAGMWWKAAIGACAAVLLGVAIVAWLLPPGTPGSAAIPTAAGGADQNNAAALAPEAAADPPQDPLAAARELSFVRNDELEHWKYDEELKHLHLSAGGKQLLVLGNLAPGERTISFDLDFTDDLGDAGIFFGLRNEVHDGERAAAAHLVYLNIFEANEQPVLFRLWRMQGLIRTNRNPPHSFVGRYEELPLPDKTRTFMFEIAFANEGIRSIKVNGQQYKTLLTMDGPYQAFEPADVWGEWGFYNDGATLRVSNLRVSGGAEE